MSEFVKVIYEGLNKRGFAIGKQEAVHFVPGINMIPRDQWAKLMKDKDPGGVTHFLKNRQMVLAEDTVQEAEVVEAPVAGEKEPVAVMDIGAMSAQGAIEVVENTMTADLLKALIPLEQGRKSKGRKTVLAAITDRLAMMDEVQEAIDNDEAKALDGDTQDGEE